MSKRNKTKLYVSKKQILDIKEFMELYVGKEYTWSEQLTHNKMTEFLNIKKIHAPNRVCFDHMEKEDLLNGNYLVVKDEVGQTMIYENPRRSLVKLQVELNMSYNEEEMEKRRKFALDSYYDELENSEKQKILIKK
ncbi:MAG: hypothetical protein J6G98_04195 [Bacilli bacterium]|nr:hypothetical protein [Bacilli bacterium]